MCAIPDVQQVKVKGSPIKYQKSPFLQPTATQQRRIHKNETVSQFFFLRISKTFTIKISLFML